MRSVGFIPSWFEDRKGLTPEGLVTPELISKLIEYSKFKTMEAGREDLKGLMGSGEPVSYSSFVSGIFDLYGKARDKRLVGDKTPRYVRSIPTLHALWPTTKFIHIIRDGRDVCLSMMNWKKADHSAGQFAIWEEDRISTVALWWEYNVRLGREAEESLPPELYYEVRYEALVSKPADECAAICDFLGLPYDDVMLRFHEGREKADPGLDAKKAWRPVTAGLRNWRSQMPAENIERFEAAAGDLLEELGYPRAAPDPPKEKLEDAARFRDSFVRDLRARGERLPEGWRR